MRPVARGIGRSKQADDRSLKRGGEMQRPCVGGDHEFCPPQRRHQRAKFERQRNWRRISRRANYLLRQLFFTRTKSDDSAKIILPNKLTMEFSVALGGPTFRAPASSGI